MRTKRSSQPTNWKKELLSWAVTLGCGLALALIIRSFLLVNATVLSGSMENTIMTGDRVFGNRLAYVSKDPQRFDMVIFLYPDNEAERYVKRIIGLPGETLEIREGKVYVDGAQEPLPDSFVQGVPRGDFGPFNVPEGHYFMLGDNRNNSHDSKNWESPYVAKGKILGKLVVCYYPKPRILRDFEGGAALKSDFIAFTAMADEQQTDA